MVVTVAIWFGIMGSCLSSDRIYYLFSRISSRLALYFSMTLRSIPQLKERYEMVRQGQIALGAHTPDGRRKKLSQMGKELSILLSWSLEDSIEVSDSMEARGYGLKGRTSYRRYQMRKRDWILAALLICLSIPVWTAVLSGSLRLYFFPAYVLPERNRMTGCAFGFFVCLLLLPLAEDKATELKNGREADADE